MVGGFEAWDLGVYALWLGVENLGVGVGGLRFFGVMRIFQGRIRFRDGPTA